MVHPRRGPARPSGICRRPPGPGHLTAPGAGRLSSCGVLARREAAQRRPATCTGPTSPQHPRSRWFRDDGGGWWTTWPRGRPARWLAPGIGVTVLAHDDGMGQDQPHDRVARRHEDRPGQRPHCHSRGGGGSRSTLTFFDDDLGSTSRSRPWSGRSVTVAATPARSSPPSGDDNTNGDAATTSGVRVPELRRR